jgi:ribulose-5-phosphate 4-epimerase/fuculose-1-phosphate aldolase
VWAPSKLPPIGVDLTDEQTLAIAFRHLAELGFAENMAGHITWQLDGQTDMLVNPWSVAAGTLPPRSTCTQNCTGCTPTRVW